MMENPSATASEALAQSVVAVMYANDAFSQWLGVELLEIRPHYAKLKMTVRDEMTNGFGVCHGGVTFSFADSALAFASNTAGKVTVSVENSITYPTRVMSGDVLCCVAEPLAIGRKLSTFQAHITRADGTLVGHFKGTVYHTEKEHQGLADTTT